MKKSPTMMPAEVRSRSGSAMSQNEIRLSTMANVLTVDYLISGDSRFSAEMSELYADLAKAQHQGDVEGADYVRKTIREFLQGLPADGEIDEPLLPVRRGRRLANQSIGKRKRVLNSR